jgi:hypothetical protein
LNVNDPKQTKPLQIQVDLPNLGRREILLCGLIVVGVALIAGFGFADPSQQGRVAFSFLSAVMGGLIGFVAVAVFIFIWQFFQQQQQIVKTVIVPVGSVALISRHGRRMSVSHGPEIKINEALGETYQLIDMRERQSDLEHTCKSADRKDVKLTGFIVWRIANVEAFLDRAQKPEEMMTRVMKAAMMGVVGRYEAKPLASRLDALPYEIASSARGYLSAYGVGLVSVFFTGAELQGSSKSDAEVEADHLLKIGQAAKEAGERALEHVEKMAQARAGR